MAQEKRRHLADAVQPILPDERAAAERRRSAEHDPTETTGDELGAVVNEEPVPDAAEAAADAQLPTDAEDVPWEGLTEVE
jgi:hypothetical protein